MTVDNWEWNVAQEAQLLDIMIGHKPVGICKHFQMYFIWEKLTEVVKKDIDSANIWKHLNTMYNLEALNDADPLPFQNNEIEFSLPDNEFESLKSKKVDWSDDRKSSKGRDTPKLKELRKEDKERITPSRNTKESQRRDSKDSNKDLKTSSAKKDVKRDSLEKGKIAKGRSSTASREEKGGKGKTDELAVKTAPKRPTRGSLSLKTEDANSSGKSSPQTVGQAKRRRI